ncbi:MAG: hypothetical protein J6L70_04000 [Alphaproteobacteria bacterium]|nr:hypothetical protein [Alphaproteobacteria bacterium]
MKVTKETKNQICVLLMTGLLTVGGAFGAQWLFNKCFGNDAETSKKAILDAQCETTNKVDSLYMYNLQKNR